MSATDGGAVRVEAVADGGAMARFIRLPFYLHHNDPHWVPPLVMERRDHLNPRKNPWFDHGEARYWLAYRGDRPSDQPVGRISAQIDRTYLDRYGDATGHFGFLEGADDGAVFHGLFSAAEGWLRKRGMSRVRGPFSLSINDETGLLVDGFDTPPSMMMGHAPPYYGPRVEAEGYGKAMDMLAYLYESHQVMPHGPKALIARLRQAGDVTLRPLDKRHYDHDLGIILDIFNDAWSNNWGFVPFTAAEVTHLAAELRPLIRSNLVCIAEVGGEPAAMAVSLPNLNEAIADLGGALLPFGWVKLLWRLKVGPMKSVRVPLMGVRRKFHGRWQGAALAFAVIDSVHGRLMAEGFERAEMSWVLETNRPMRRLLEAVGARPYKTYRVYEKALA